jgi:hypothetical protein
MLTLVPQGFVRISSKVAVAFLKISVEIRVRIVFVVVV